MEFINDEQLCNVQCIGVGMAWNRTCARLTIAIGIVGVEVLGAAKFRVAGVAGVGVAIAWDRASISATPTS